MIFGRDIVVACYTGQEQHRRFRWNVICDGGIGCYAKSAIDSCSPTYAAFHRFPYASRSNFLGNSDTLNRVQVIYALPERWVTVLECTPYVRQEIGNSSR